MPDNRKFTTFILTISILITSGCSLTGTTSRRSDGLDSILSTDAEPVLVLDGTDRGLRMTEGPTWFNGSLFFSDQPKGFHRLDSDGSWRLINTDGWTCGSAPFTDGNLAVCYVAGPAIVKMSQEGKILDTLVDSFDGAPLFGNPNDIIIDSHGGLYFTLTPFFGKDAEKNCAVMYRKPDGDLIMVTGKNEYVFPNGCALNPKGDRFYLNDSRSGTVTMYDVEKDGTLTGKRPFAKLHIPDDPSGEKRKRVGADGMAVDNKGNLYVTTMVGVQVFDNNGRFQGIISVPFPPSNCVFGGDGLSTLYITCRKQIYTIKTKVHGVRRFAE